MGKKLFKKISYKKLSQGKGITVANRFMSIRYAYIDGYFTASDFLISTALQLSDSHKKDILFFPICFNYRHYLELHIKNLIEDCALLYEKMDKLGYLPEDITSLPDKDKKISEIHSLSQLLNILKNRLIVSEEEFPQDIESYILQMHNTDTNGQKYRYHKDKNSKTFFTEEEYFDLKNLQEIMSKVRKMLFAIGDFIDDRIQLSDSIIQDYESNY